jgi:hypothetical protein
LRADEAASALELLLCEREPRARLLEPGLGAGDLRLVRTLIDDEERRPRLHDRALVESHPLHEAGDARADLHRLDGFEMTGKLVPLGDLMVDDRCHGDFGRRGRGGRLFAPCDQEQQHRDGRTGDGTSDLPHLSWLDLGNLGYNAMLLTGNTRYVTDRYHARQVWSPRLPSSVTDS